MAVSDPLSISGTFLSTGRLQDLFRDTPSLSDSVKLSFASPIAIYGHKSSSCGTPRVLSDLRDIVYKSSEEFQVPKICFGSPTFPSPRSILLPPTMTDTGAGTKRPLSVDLVNLGYNSKGQKVLK